MVTLCARAGRVGGRLWEQQSHCRSNGSGVDSRSRCSSKMPAQEPARKELQRSGQYKRYSGRCYATDPKTGKPCSRPAANHIPYCSQHCQTGDSSVKVVSHPFAGKILVARRDLPKGYKIVYWGERKRTKDATEDRMLSGPYPTFGVVDPVSFTGSVVQFMGCPGPNEVQNCILTGHYFIEKDSRLVGVEYETSMPIPKGGQLLQWYGPGWWKAREEEQGFKRGNIGTRRHPAPLKKLAYKRTIGEAGGALQDATNRKKRGGARAAGKESAAPLPPNSVVHEGRAWGPVA